MDNFNLRKYLSEGKLLKEDDEHILNDVLSWLEEINGFSDSELDGLRYGEVGEFEVEEVPVNILKYLKNVERFDFSINGERGYVLYYVSRTNQVWFENLN